MNETKNNTTVNGVNGVAATGTMGTAEHKDTKETKATGTATGKASKIAKSKKNGKHGKASKAKSAKQGKKKGKAVKATAKTAKTGKPLVSKTTKPAKIENADGCPFRPTSSYGKLWSFLLKHREKGISRADFIKQGAKLIGKDEKHTSYDVAVVASPTKDGAAHPSANRAADHYFVERTEGGLLKLHRR